MTDADLLRSYVREGCEKAFEEIARRYTPLVYSTCLRRLGDAHAAEDAAQATFLALARKAGGFGRGVVLAAWLYRAAEVSAQTHARTERRRARREREAARMKESSGSNRDGEGWESLRALVDDAVAALPARYRDVIVLRYLAGRLEREMAEELGKPLGTVKSLLSRGIDKLRAALARRGVGAEAFSAMLAGGAVEAAPAGLAASIAAVATGKAAASSAAVSIAEGAMRAMMIAKLKMAAAVVAVMMAAGVGTGVVVVKAAESGGAEAPSGRAVVDMAFQQGSGGYSGCKLDHSWGPENREGFDLGEGLTLRFTGLELPGKDPKVEAARLEMSFGGEGFGRISSARLEVYDAASAEGAALSTVDYSGNKMVGMDPATRFVSWKLPAGLVAQWIKDPGSNKGLRFKVIPGKQDNFNFAFQGLTCKTVEKRPRLVVTYSFSGNAAPFIPEVVTRIEGKTFGPRFTVEWKQKRWDPNGTPVIYEIAIVPEGGAAKKVGETDAEKLLFEVDASKLDVTKRYGLAVRARDPEGLSTEWIAAPGSFSVTRDEYVVWTQDSVTKVGREQSPPGRPAAVRIAAARNEYESFQIVVTALSNIGGVDVEVGDLRGPGGASIPKSSLALYRVNYVNCEGQGLLPDSMVPFIDPVSGRRIGGKYGAPFDVPAGTNVSTWVEIHVPADAAPGEYSGSAKVAVGGKPAREIPVGLTVWPVALPPTSTLLTYFELTYDTPKRDYLHALHQHRMDVWFVNGIGHDLAREGGKPVVKWNPEFDKLLDAYFDGSLFADRVPGKSYHLPCASWKVYEAVKGNDEDRIEILKQYEAHYRDKPYASRLSWFFIDEPDANTLAKCVRVGQQIKEHSPSLKFFLTTRYNKNLVGLVDIWDPIINVEVIDSTSPGPDVYREEMKQGRTVINCITVTSDTPTGPNLFIHHRGMNTRIWTWVTFALDQQGIEFWRVNAAPSVTVPNKYGNTWGDGTLFYKGLPAELGVAEELPLPSLRLKMLRDGIEDFELLSMLKKKDPALARKLSRLMVQETKDYDKSFANPVQHMSWNWNTDGKGDRQVPGHVVWESSPERIAAARAAIAAALGR